APRLLLVFAALALLVVSDRLPELPRGLAYGVPCTLLMAAAVLAPARPIRSRWIEFWVLLGDASYALYLVHPFPMRAFELVWLRLGWTVRPPPPPDGCCTPERPTKPRNPRARPIAAPSAGPCCGLATQNVRTSH